MKIPWETTDSSFNSGGEIDAELEVKSYLHTFTGISTIKKCQLTCKSVDRCSHFVFDTSGKNCSLISMDVFGTLDTVCFLLIYSQNITKA